MKFYPLSNWQKGQKVVLIDGEQYYILDAIMNWQLDKEGERIADLAPYGGLGWMEKKDKKGMVTVKMPRQPMDWLHEKLADEEIILVASTPQCLAIG